MSTSFFGGDPSKSHFTCQSALPIRSKERAEAYAKIKAAFPGREKYFQYPNGNAGLKAAARKRAEAHAADILAKTGVEVYISEGFFL